MAGPVPSTSNWTLDLDEIVAEAQSRLRLPPEPGYDFERAKRAVMFVFARLTAMGLNRWTIEQATLDLIQDEPRYLLDTDTLDVLEMVVRDTNQATISDLPVGRMSRDDYLAIPQKLNRGRPLMAWVERTRTRPILHFYNVPDKAGWRLIYNRVRCFRDLGTPLDAVDVPNHWLGIIVAGVTHYLAMTRPELTAADRAEAKAIFLDEIAAITPEDRDRGPIRIQLDMSDYYRP